MSTYLHRVTGYQQSPASSLADLLSGGESTRWMTQGACVPRDKWELFHHQDDGFGATTEARKTCSTCPVLDKCREWGIENHQDEGIIGGLDRRERTRLSRAKVAQSKPKPDVDLGANAFTSAEIRIITGMSRDGMRRRIARLNPRIVGQRGDVDLYERSPELLERSARALR